MDLFDHKFKIIFAGAGWWLLGSVGVYLGYLLGKTADEKSNAKKAQKEIEELENAAAQWHRHRRESELGILVSLMLLFAELIRQDRKMHTKELAFVRHFLEKNLNNRARVETAYELLVNAVRNPRRMPLHEICVQIRKNMSIAERRELLHLLFGLAAADADLCKEELSLLSQITILLGLSSADFYSYKAMFLQPETPKQSANWAYLALGISQNATDDEVRRAYRSMALKHHPDRVASAGENIQKAATEKFRKIQEAYENIKTERGLK